MENDFDKKVKINDKLEIDNLISNGAQVSVTVKNILKKFLKFSNNC